MTTHFETQQFGAVPVQSGGRPCTLIPESSGWVCGREAGHEPPCGAAQINTEPPAADPQPGPAPAASSAPKPYGITRRRPIDVYLPNGDRVLVRQLTTSEVIALKIVRMQDAFTPELMKGVNADDPQVAEQEFGRALLDPVRGDKLIEPLNRVLAAAVVCPKVLLERPDDRELGDDELHVDEIDIIDKWILFEAAMPDGMKAAAVEAQHNALKSVRAEQESGV